MNCSEPVIGPCFALLCFSRNTLTHIVIARHDTEGHEIMLAASKHAIQLNDQDSQVW